jgi:hypothetical protein
MSAARCERRSAMAKSARWSLLCMLSLIHHLINHDDEGQVDLMSARSKG